MLVFEWFLFIAIWNPCKCSSVSLFVCVLVYSYTTIILNLNKFRHFLYGWPIISCKCKHYLTIITYTPISIFALQKYLFFYMYCFMFQEIYYVHIPIYISQSCFIQISLVLAECSIITVGLEKLFVHTNVVNRSINFEFLHDVKTPKHWNNVRLVILF